MSLPPSVSSLEIRPLTALSEFERCVELQILVWRYSDGDVIPRRMFVIAHRIGGQVLGGFVDGTMVGFAMALPGYREGMAYLHSHMLAVLPGFRNGGLGRRLKLAQREDAIARGFDLMEWTFDPLEIKNARLNLHRLGAISRRYQENFYGPSSSPLQGGLPTDRLCAEWWLRSAHVEQMLASIPRKEVIEVRVEVPADIFAWKQSPSEHGRARAAQDRVREQLVARFEQGLATIDYEIDDVGNGAYLLGHWRQQETNATAQAPLGEREGRDRG